MSNIQIMYVAQHGYDDAEGTAELPFATIARAQRAARAAVRKGLAVRVRIQQGTYYLDQPLQFGSEDSGTQDAPVIYEADQEGEVIISGGHALRLEWLPYEGEIRMAKTPPGLKLDRLFINGTQYHMARYPDYNANIRIMNGFAADSVSRERAANWADPTGGYIHAMHSRLWGDYRYRIMGKYEDHELILKGGWQNNRQMGMHHEYRYVENIFEELDTPGEWYHDQKTNILYVYPYEGTEVSNALVVGTQLAHLIEIQGSPEAPVRHIEFFGLTFTQTNRTFMENRESLLRSDWTIYRGGAILFRGAEHCTIRDCTFVDLGGNALFVDGYNRHITVTSCLLEEIGSNGIAFVGRPDSVRSPLFGYEERQKLANLDSMPGPKTNNYPAQCYVEDCLITKVGRVEKQSAPIQISMSLDVTVRHCSIYDVPRAGINISEGTFGGHLIEFCDVFETVLETGDHGSFNSWGRDRYWMLEDVEVDEINRNAEAPLSELPLLDIVRPIVIRNNRWRCDYGWDIDLDDGSSWYEIYNNLCLAGGIKLREGFYRNCENNIMVNNTLHPHVWFKGSRDVIRRNIMFTEYAPIRVPPPWGSECDNNILHLQGMTCPESASQLQEQSGRDKGSLVADALFVDPASGDYRVREGSPALKLGFVNFPMDQFGVRKASLKERARTPKIPQIGEVVSTSGRIAQRTDWGKCKVKNIVGMGEVSAGGLPSESGVIIETIPWGSWQNESGFEIDDVIVKFDEAEIDTVDDLLSHFESAVQGSIFEVTVFRKQGRIIVQAHKK